MVHNYEVWEMVTIKSGVHPGTKIMYSIQFPINMTNLECHLVVSFFVKVVNRGGGELNYYVYFLDFLKDNFNFKNNNLKNYRGKQLPYLST